MSDTARPKRLSLQARSGSRPPRDPRSESRPPTTDDPRRRRTAGSESSPPRMAAIAAELTRMKEERGAEADQLAKMLVRIAATERARATAEERAAAFADR